MINIQFEEAVIGAFILEANNCKDQIEVCQPDWFSLPAHRIVFEAIQSLNQETEARIDALTVFNKCKGQQITAFEIAKITDRVSSSANIEYHMRILQQLYVGRQLKDICKAYSEQDQEDPFTAISQLRSKLESIDIVQGDNTERLRDIFDRRLDELDRRRKAEVKIIGRRSGFPTLDVFIGGFVPSEFIVIAGRPSMGKTAFAVNLGIAHCETDGSVLMFSVEMNSESISDRVAASKSGVDGLKIRGAELDDYDMERIARVNIPVNFYINDNASNNIDTMAGIIRRYKNKHNITAVIIDYVQLLKGVDKQNREQQIAYISRRCKQIAKEYDVCMIGLAQLNREADGIEPRISHLRESGAIEQDADTVLFPYRPDKDNPSKSDLENAMLIIAKCRNGKTGAINMNFHSPTITYKW